MTNNTSQHLLLISHHNSYRIAPYIKAAKSLGLEVTIASEGSHSLISEVASGLHIDFSNYDLSLEAIIAENHKLSAMLKYKVFLYML